MNNLSGDQGVHPVRPASPSDEGVPALRPLGPQPGQPVPVPHHAPIPVPHHAPTPVTHPAATPVAPHAPGAGADPATASKIQLFEQRMGSGKRHEDRWKRTPNLTGTGAIHVKSFHCKLIGDTLEYLDQQINEWLDAHPQYEVKFVTSTIGDWTGKVKEPNLIVQVWV